MKFNGIAAVITSASATSLVVTAPATGTTGAITVATSGGLATGPVFTYLHAPVIATVNPTSAAAGATVTITGTNFDATAANNVVKFNGVVAAITSASVTQLVVTVPATGSTGNVTVTTPVGTSNTVAFQYLAATGPNVYVLGSDTRSGYGWWKNSTFNYIADCTSAYGFAGSGSDTYIAGPAKSNTPTYWKNGTEVQLSSQTGFTFSIVVSGTDVYVLGTLNGAYCTWKNGTPTNLTKNGIINVGNGYYLTNDLAVHNGDVYTAGEENVGTSIYTKAVYWKNGAPVYLTDGITSGSALGNAVAISGNDVYVAGIETVRNAAGGIVNQAPRLWKNGASIPLTTPANSIDNAVTSILVVGSDVYVGGRYNGQGAVWKNGTMINVATYGLAEYVSSMFLYNNTDLYFSGAASVSGNNCYWKNGNFVEMDPGCGALSATCANTSANQVISIYVK